MIRRVIFQAFSHCRVKTVSNVVDYPTLKRFLEVRKLKHRTCHATIRSAYPQCYAKLTCRWKTARRICANAVAWL